MAKKLTAIELKRLKKLYEEIKKYRMRFLKPRSISGDVFNYMEVKAKELFKKFEIIKSLQTLEIQKLLELFYKAQQDHFTKIGLIEHDREIKQIVDKESLIIEKLFKRALYLFSLGEKFPKKKKDYFVGLETLFHAIQEIIHKEMLQEEDSCQLEFSFMRR